MADEIDPKSERMRGATTGAEPSDSSTPITEMTDSDLNRYQSYEIPAGVRKQWIEAELPRLDPRVLQDTLPPNVEGTGSHASSASAEVAPQAQDRESLPVLLVPRSRARHSGIWVIAILLPVLGLALYALLTQRKDVAPSRAAATVAKAGEPSAPRSAAPATASSSAPPAAAPSQTSSSQPAPAARSIELSGAPGSPDHKPAVPGRRTEGTKRPTAPLQPTPARPASTRSEPEPAPGGLFDKVPVRPAD